MVPDAAECGAISRRCRVARRSPRWCGGDCRARSCGPGGTARSAVPAQPIGHLSKRHHQFHLSWPEYWDRTQGLTDPNATMSSDRPYDPSPVALSNDGTYLAATPEHGLV